ncbi:MAG: MAP7 domain-containing protein [Candidatus Thorarchaeota archaeon]
MAYLIYYHMNANDVWHWNAPYDFVVTVFRLLSLIFFFLSFVLVLGLSTAITGAMPNDLIVGLYNTIVLRTWYMQPYGIPGPITNPDEVFIRFTNDIFVVIDSLFENTFLFLYFLCAGIGVALFLQSLFRMEHKYVGGAFVSLQLILVIAVLRNFAFGFYFIEDLLIPNYAEGFPTDFIVFLTSDIQILVLVSFAYLELSYQMIYSYSVGKPVEDREETLKKQLLALRQATRKQDAIERGEKVSITAMSRSSGATAFSFLREAIERKVVGSKDALENLDAVSDVRRLQIFVDDLLASDSRARDELTAKAAAPSSAYVIGSTIMGSAFRFLSVIAISFMLMSPTVFLAILNPPVGIQSSLEVLQPEIVLLFLVPVVLLFPFAAMVISWFSKREVVKEEKMTKAEKEAMKAQKKELDRKKKETARKRKAREKARKKMKRKPEEADEWDKALEETYKT